MKNSNPQNAFGPAPFWAWTSDLTPEKIDRDLRRFLKMEIHELVIMPLYGLKPRYLGPEYLRLYAYTCRRCRQWGLKIWIYDEFNWPSGTCAGKVLREHPEARQQILRFEFPATGQTGRPAWKIEEYAGFNLADYGAAWTAESTGYLDTLNADAVGHYIRLTHEAYRAAVGEYFGDVVLGFYSDEPVMVRGGKCLPFTPGLFAMFRQRYGYDLERDVLSLAMDTPRAPRLRRDYWALVSELFQVNFFRQYAGWCRKHGLQMTGHLLYEEMLSSQVQYNGDMYDMLSEMQTPGIDMLDGMTSFDQRGLRATMGGEACADIPGKLIESIGFFGGKKRLMCEAYGITAHDCTAQFYKRASDYLFHHGISLMNDNLFADSQGSFRSGFGCHSFWTPWTRHYQHLARHVRGMSRLNSGSRLETEIAIYCPGQDLWRRFGPAGTFFGNRPPDAAWQATQQTLLNLTHGLIRRHWNFYYIFDQVLDRAEFGRRGLTVAGFNCRVMLLPDVHAVSESAAAALRRFLANGGRLICARRRPAVFDAAGRLHQPAWLTGPRVLDVQCPMNELADQAVRLLEQVARRAVVIGGTHTDQVMLTHRHARGREFVFMTNFGAQAADLQTNLGPAWRPIAMDAAAAGRNDAAPRRLLLRPNESILLERGRRARVAPARPPTGERKVILPAVWGFRLPEGNTCNLPVQICQGPVRQKFPPAGARSWSAACVETAPVELIPGRAYWLRGMFQVEEKPRCLQVVTDGCDRCEVYLNRRRVAGGHVRRLWDDANLTFDLTPRVILGENEVLIRYTPNQDRKYVARFWPLTCLPPFVLAGQFMQGFAPPGRPLILTAPARTAQVGDLALMGCPGLAGVAEYAARVRLRRTGREVVLDLGAQNDTFAVIINGQTAGTLLWPPYRLAVGRWLRPGVNRIVLRLHTAMAGILTRAYRKPDPGRPPTPVGLLDTPILCGAD